MASGCVRLPGNLRRSCAGRRAARRVIRTFRPQVMLLTGGYVGVPAALAGRGVPKVLYVPDIEPALAARLMARLAHIVAVTAEDSRRFYSRRSRVVVSGYPTRSDLTPATKLEARARLGLSTEGNVVVVLGGSRGARSINEALWAGLAQLLPIAQVIHLTGQLDFPRAVEVRAHLPTEVEGALLPGRLPARGNGGGLCRCRPGHRPRRGLDAGRAAALRPARRSWCPIPMPGATSTSTPTT